MSLGQVAWNKGISPSEETCAKMSVAHTGLKASPETRAKISAGEMGHAFWGEKYHTPETRAKMSAANMGNTNCLGRHWTDEERAKISVAKMGHPATGPKHHTAETRAKMSAANWKGGRQLSSRKTKAKRRLFGFNPLNSWFLGCEGHHINSLDVIYMPRVLHCSIRHNQYTGRGMVAMNALAGAFLTEDWT